MQTNHIVDVLVVGAGPVGLFCAHELHRHGLTCRIIDKKGGLSDKSKALGIHIRTLDVMEDCGLLKEILLQGHQVRGARLNSTGRQLVEVTFDQVGSDRHYLIDLPQNKTEAILNQHLSEKGIHVEWHSELLTIDQQPSSVEARIKNENGQHETVQAKWIIACDGAHSTMRHLVGEVFVGSAYEQNWWLADVYVDWDQPEDLMMIYISEKGPLACFPMGKQRYRVVMTAPPAFRGEPELADIAQEFKQRSQAKFSLSNPQWISQFSIHHRQIQQYRHQRVFFAGDAAHIHSPMGGQGLNTGIQDIYNLVWKLALVNKDLAQDALLDSYQAERFPVGKNVLKKTDMMTKMILLQNPILIRLRNNFIRLVTSIQWIKTALAKDLAELTISYAKSPIVINQATSCQFKAGQFVGHFTLINKQDGLGLSIQQITQGTLHHLFLFTGMNPPLMLADMAVNLQKKVGKWLQIHLVTNDTIARKLDFPAIFIDDNEKVHQQFAIEQPTALLVRPDKYIGLVQSPVNVDSLLNSIRKMAINVT